MHARGGKFLRNFAPPLPAAAETRPRTYVRDRERMPHSLQVWHSMSALLLEQEGLCAITLLFIIFPSALFFAGGCQACTATPAISPKSGRSMYCEAARLLNWRQSRASPYDNASCNSSSFCRVCWVPRRVKRGRNRLVVCNRAMAKLQRHLFCAPTGTASIYSTYT